MYDLNTQEGLEAAKRWVQHTLALLKSGGVWMVPRSGSLYTIDHETKTARRIGVLPDPSIDYVLRLAGWAVYTDDQS